MGKMLPSHGTWCVRLAGKEEAAPASLCQEGNRQGRAQQFAASSSPTAAFIYIPSIPSPLSQFLQQLLAQAAESTAQPWAGSVQDPHSAQDGERMGAEP